MATALLQPVDGSGVCAELTLYESEDGTTLTVLGVATGMRMLGQYLSLACYSDGNGAPSTADTLLGLWKGPLGTGVGAKRTLQVVRPTGPPGVHLYEIDTVSIHRPSAWLWGDPPQGMRARRLSLVACGEILRVP